MPRPTLNRRQLIAAAGISLMPLGRAVMAQDDDPIRRGGVPLVALPSVPAHLGDDAGKSWETDWLRTLVYDAPLRPLDSGAVVAAVGIGLGLSRGTDSIDLLARPGVLFADGAPVTVADLAASIERSIDRSDPLEAWRWDRIAMVDVDDHRVHLRLSQPDATLAATLASPLVPITPGGVTVAGVQVPDLPPGTGPFIPGHLDHDTVTFRHNRAHWVIGQPRLDGCAVIGEENVIARTSRLVTGMVDVMPDVPALDIPLLRDDPGVTLVGGISRRLCALVLNLRHEPLNDVRVRQLVAGVNDRDRLVEGVTAGTGVPAATLFPDEHWAGAENPEPASRASPGEARDGLAALGLLPGWSLRLISPADQPTLANTAILLQEQLGAAGIVLEIALLDASAFAAARDAGAFDLMVTLLPTWIDPHELAYPWLHSEGAGNAGGFASARVDGLLDRARTQSDDEVRGSLYSDIQRVVTDQAPLVPLFATPWVDAVRSRVQGYTTHLQPSARGIASAWFAEP